MRKAVVAIGLLGCIVVPAVRFQALGQATPTPSPATSPSATPSPSLSPTATPTPSPTPSPTPPPTPPPIIVTPAAAQAPVGVPSTLLVSSAVPPITAVANDPNLVDVSVNQATQVVTLLGKTPGTTVVTISDERGLTKAVPITVAYQAGTIPPQLDLRLTGDPASADFVRDNVAAVVKKAAQLRPGAQAVVGPDDVAFTGQLNEDDVAEIDASWLTQGEQYFSVTGKSTVRVENVAVPRVSPDILMVSDFPEALTETGVLFSSDLRPEIPSRFLFYHYNPPDQPDRRIVLRAQNQNAEPAIVQVIFGSGGPDKNEMESGHEADREFLVHMLQNEGRIVEIPANGSLNLVNDDLPHGTTVCALLQLRVLSGGHVGLHLLAQDAGDDPNAPITQSDLLVGAQRHARGIYNVPEFHEERSWSVDDPYLELPIGQLPLQNSMQGEALSGDYGVLEAFVVNVQNPTSQPQPIAIYENPRGGSATGTYLIDGTLVQSHQVPAFSRYKLRQYVVPARGFVRITIVTMPEGGSSYPLTLLFAPDDGSVAPEAAGSPIY